MKPLHGKQLQGQLAAAMLPTEKIGSYRDRTVEVVLGLNFART